MFVRCQGLAEGLLLVVIYSAGEKIFPFSFFFSMNNSLFSRRNTCSKKLLPEEKYIALKQSRFHRETPRHFTAKIDFPRRKKS